MDFALTDEQQQLQDAVQRFVRGRYGFEFRKSVMRSADGLDRGIWQGLAELGLLGLRVPEAQGGMGLGAIETALAMQAAGPALLIEPWLDVGVTAATVLAAAGDGAAADALLPAIAGGERIVVLAHTEAAARGDARVVQATVAAQGDALRLDGHKAVIGGAGVADEWLVSAREGEGVSLLRVPRGTAGVSVRPCTTIDGRRAADLQFDGVVLPPSARVGAAGAALAAIEHALDTTQAALCAEAVGVMQATVDATVEYLKTRQQFGQPIGRFQALQHRMAEMLLHQEQARSMSYFAAMHCTAADATARRRTLSAAKVTIGQACRFIAQNAVQLHGGMGMTDELIVSHWFKRLTAIEMSFGDTDFHLQRFAANLAREARAA